jgi:hypothetical protein
VSMVGPTPLGSCFILFYFYFFYLGARERGGTDTVGLQRDGERRDRGLGISLGYF